jgi:hypothetical protein
MNHELITGAYTQELITGGFTLIGAVVGGLLSKYGIPLIENSHKIKYEGKGRDIDLSSIVPEFEDKSLFEYDFKNFDIYKTKSKVCISCNEVIASKNNETVTWSISGKGPLIDGVAYCQFVTESHVNGVHWNGVLALTFTSGGRTLGFWITENTAFKGRMAFGVMELKAKR